MPDENSHPTQLRLPAQISYEELTKRDKVNLDVFRLKDAALEESANLPAPEIIAQEITADLEAALE